MVVSLWSSVAFLMFCPLFERELQARLKAWSGHFTMVLIWKHVLDQGKPLVVAALEDDRQTERIGEGRIIERFFKLSRIKIYSGWEVPVVLREGFLAPKHESIAI